MKRTLILQCPGMVCSPPVVSKCLGEAHRRLELFTLITFFSLHTVGNIGMSTTTDPITTEVSTSSLTTNRIGVLIQQNEELEDEVGDLKTNVIGLSVGVPLTLVITVVLFSVFFIIIRFSREARNSIFPE